MNKTASTLFDSHTHLDAPIFDVDRATVLERAAEAGVTDILLAAVSAQHWPRLRDTCSGQQHTPRLHAAYGLQPMFMQQHQDDHLALLANWLQQQPAIAIGECGLDFQVGKDPERQRHFFCHQLGLAREMNLPVIIHARKAVEDVLLMLRREGPVRGVVHSYSGSIEQARQLWGLGLLIGLGGPVTHDHARRLHRLATTVPLEQLLLETDAPGQPGAAHRGQRNEPAFLTEVLQRIAALRSMSCEELAAATRVNAQHLFRLAQD